MAHHKRKRPKHQRGGCLMCKGYKDERVKGALDSQPVPVRRKLQRKDTTSYARYALKIPRWDFYSY